MKKNVRHRLSTRIWHWANAVTLLVMLMSGLMIFNAHPRLYWGEYGANSDYAWMAVGSSDTAAYLRFGETRIPTTGVLGLWEDRNGEMQNWAFPGWATIPTDYNLADARLWHFLFAWALSFNLLFFLVRALWNRHIQRDLHIRAREWRPSHIWHDIKEHALLRFPKGADAHDYNVLQKLAYGSVIFLMIPLMIWTGLAMSPAMDANWPILTEVFGGRQSARSVHFIVAWALVGFFIVHMIMVLLSHPIHQLKSMITGGERPARDSEGEAA